MIITESQSESLPDISSLIPHRDKMALLDRVVSVDAVSLCAEVTIRSDHLFYDDDSRSVGAWVGIEMMAQAMAAFEGYQAWTQDKPVKVGFLLGTRYYESHCNGFPLGSRLQISVTQVIKHANGLGAFDCKICHAGAPENDVLAAATLTAFQPDDVQQFLRNNNPLKTDPPETD